MNLHDMPAGQLLQWIAVGLILAGAAAVIVLKIIRFNRKLHCNDSPACGNCCSACDEKCDCRIKDLKKKSR